MNLLARIAFVWGAAALLTSAAASATAEPPAAPAKPQSSPLVSLREALPEISAAVSKALGAEPQSESLKAASAALGKLSRAVDAAAAHPVSAEALESEAKAREAEARKRVKLAQIRRDASRLEKDGKKVEALEKIREGLALDDQNNGLRAQLAALDADEYEKFAKASLSKPLAGAPLELNGRDHRLMDLRLRVNNLEGTGKFEAAMAAIDKYDAEEPALGSNGRAPEEMRRRVGGNWVAREVGEANRLLRLAAESSRSPELPRHSVRLAELAKAWDGKSAPDAEFLKLANAREEEVREHVAVAQFFRQSAALAKDKRYAEAINALKQILNLDPGNRLAESRIRMLQELMKQ